MNKFLLLFIIIFCVSVIAQDEKDTKTTLPAAAIGVTIGGNFPVTGTFPSYLNERVDQFITRIFNQAKEKALSRGTTPVELEEIEKQFGKYSFRGIMLKRVNGEQQSLDLLKFRRTGDFSNNPYLRHDDVLIFPATEMETNFFTVSGAVMEPGKFAYIEGDNLAGAVELAAGINKAYSNISVKIYRVNAEGSGLDELSAGLNENFMLQRGDRVVVSGINEKRDYKVFIAGEVKNPGTIPISKNNTTLKEVIERAGGLKETASLKNSRLYTGKTAEFVLQNIYGMDLGSRANYDILEDRLAKEKVDVERMMMLRLSTITEVDTAYFSIENSLRVLTEGSAVNFTDISETNSASASYIVKDGDIIVIPQKKNTVYVFGNAAHQGNIPFEEGKDVSFYIGQAGGYGENALQDEVFLIKGSSRKWIPAGENPKVEEGDYIYIPRSEEHSFNYYVEVAARYLGIVGSAATIILLLVQFGK